MTKSETLKIIAVLQVAYPNTNKQSDEDKLAMVRLWHRHFSCVPYSIMEQAVDMAILACKFPPNIAEINEQLQKLIMPESTIPDAVSAWAMVCKAIQNGIYNAAEEFEKLPKPVQQAVGTSYDIKEWAYLPPEQLQTIVSSHFLRAYRAIIKHEEEQSNLPENREKYFTQLTEQKGITNGEQKESKQIKIRKTTKGITENRQAAGNLSALCGKVKKI